MHFLKLNEDLSCRLKAGFNTATQEGLTARLHLNRAVEIAAAGSDYTQGYIFGVIKSISQEEMKWLRGERADPHPEPEVSACSKHDDTEYRDDPEQPEVIGLAAESKVPEAVAGMRRRYAQVIDHLGNGATLEAIAARLGSKPWMVRSFLSSHPDLAKRVK